MCVFTVRAYDHFYAQKKFIHKIDSPKIPMCVSTVNHLFFPENFSVSIFVFFFFFDLLVFRYFVSGMREILVFGLVIRKHMQKLNGISCVCFVKSSEM